MCYFESDFDKWLYNRENNHPYWELAYIDEEGNEYYGVYFNADAFVYWLNKGKKVARLKDIPNKIPKKRLGSNVQFIQWLIEVKQPLY